MNFIPAIQLSVPASTQAWCFAFVQRELLLPPGDLPVLQPLDATTFTAGATARHYLGRLADMDCWALEVPEVPPGWRTLPLRAAMQGLEAPLSGLAGRAAQILDWDRSHRFCGACGTETMIQAGERARVCPACKHTAYPRLSPAMMALVWRPGEVMLGRSPHYAPGMYSALAGFVEAGESLEDCVHREVAEEVALTITDLRYYGSQSWPFPNNLMLAFTARWASGEIVPQPGEIEDARWFPIDALPKIPPRFSISGHLIRDTVAAMLASA